MTSKNDNTNKRIEKEAAEIQSIIKETQKDTRAFLLSALQSIISEQVIAHNISVATGTYIFDAVKDQCLRKGMD